MERAPSLPGIAKSLGATKPVGTLPIVFFVPSVRRSGQPVDHDYWVTEALSTFGALFRGATAYPRARGVWRDDEEGGALKFEEPTSSSPTRTHPTLRK